MRGLQDVGPLGDDLHAGDQEVVDQEVVDGVNSQQEVVLVLQFIFINSEYR